MYNVIQVEKLDKDAAGNPVSRNPRDFEFCVEKDGELQACFQTEAEALAYMKAMDRYAITLIEKLNKAEDGSYVSRTPRDFEYCITQDDDILACFQTEQEALAYLLTVDGLVSPEQ